MQPDLIGNYVLFAINFQTVNALNQGDYFDGLAPTCAVPDAIVGDWGVSNDPLYAEAQQYIASGQCSGVAEIAAFSRAAFNATGTTVRLNAPWAMNNEQ